MRASSVLAGWLLACLLALGGCAPPIRSEADPGWTTLLDGSARLDAWERVGDANWRSVDGAVQADRGGKEGGYLVSKTSYRDVRVRAEFWVSDAANSGIFVRCTDRHSITPMNSYEVNIFDRRPDPSFGTGAIVAIAKVASPLKAGGRWNTYEIVAQGDRIAVTLNGVQTVDVRDAKFAAGPIALQYGGGVVKFRKVQVKPL